MLLVLICLSILIFILVFILLLVMSTLRIDIKELDIHNVNDKLIKTKMDIKYNIKLGIYVFNKIPIFWITLNNKKKTSELLKKILRMSKIKNNNIKEVVKEKIKIKDIIKGIKLLDPKLEKFYLDSLLDTEDVLITTALVGTISSLIGVMLGIIKIEDVSNISYRITPIYNNKNIIKINLNCIICIKLVHIINIIYIVLKKKERIKYVRTSNTGNDDNSYGKHQGYGRC